jgi:hypothetical protein
MSKGQKSNLPPSSGNDDNAASATTLTAASGCVLKVPFNELETSEKVITYLKKEASSVPADQLQAVVSEWNEKAIVSAQKQKQEAQSCHMTALTELSVMQDRESAAEQALGSARELQTRCVREAADAKDAATRIRNQLEEANVTLARAKAVVDAAAATQREAEAALARSQANLEALATKIADLERTLSKLEAQAREQDNGLRRANARQSRLATKIAELKEERAELSRAVDELKQQRAAAVKVATEAKVAGEAASDAAVLLEGERDAARAMVTHQKARATQLAAERDHLESNVAARRAEAARLYQQAAAVVDSKSTVGSGKDKHEVTVSRDNERAAIRAQASTLEAEALRLSTRVDALERERREALDAANAANREVEVLTSRLRVERSKVERANNEMTDAHARVSKCDADLAIANGQHSVLRERASTLQQEHDAAVEDAAQVAERAAELREQRTQWLAEQARLEQAVATAKANVAASSGAVAAARANSATAQQQRDQCVQEADNATKALNDADAKAANARAAVNAAADELTSAQQNTTAANDRVAAVRKHVEEVEASAKSIDNRLAAAQAYVNRRLKEEAAAEEERRRSTNNSVNKAKPNANTNTAIAAAVKAACVSSDAVTFKEDELTWGVTAADAQRLAARSFGDYKSPTRLKAEVALANYMSNFSEPRAGFVGTYVIASCIAAPGTGKSRLLDDAVRGDIAAELDANGARARSFDPRDKLLLAISFGGGTTRRCVFQVASRCVLEFFCGQPKDMRADSADSVLEKIDSELERLLPGHSVLSAQLSVLNALEALFFHVRGAALGRTVLLVDEIALAPDQLAVHDSIVGWIDNAPIAVGRGYLGRRGAVVTNITLWSPWDTTSESERPVVPIALGLFDVWSADVKDAILRDVQKYPRWSNVRTLPDNLWTLLASTGGRPRDIESILKSLHNNTSELERVLEDRLWHVLSEGVSPDPTFKSYLLPSMLSVQFVAGKKTQFGRQVASRALLNADLLVGGCSAVPAVPAVSLRYAECLPGGGNLRSVFPRLVRDTTFYDLRGDGKDFEHVWVLLLQTHLLLQHSVRQGGDREQFWPQRRCSDARAAARARVAMCSRCSLAPVRR